MKAGELQSIDIPCPVPVPTSFPYQQPVPGSDLATVGVYHVLQRAAVAAPAVVVVVAADTWEIVAQVDRLAAEEPQRVTAVVYVARSAAHRIASHSNPAVPAAEVAVVLRFPRYSLYRYIFTFSEFDAAS